jgi:phosphoribosylanthranilate isomerase
MFVKICGVTNVDDALQAVEAGADAVGMVFAESARRLDPATGRAIVRSLPPETLTVAVFRNQPLEEIREILGTTRARGAQIHGSRPGDVRSLRDAVSFVIEAFPADASVAARLERSDADLILVDSGSPGSGRPFDWTLLDGAGRRRLVLAGGLHPGNVSDAIALVRPHGVDVATGVESAPGRKDPEKVRRFVDRARAAWAETGA